ncbi:DUF2062 domain-containing protein [Deferribacterales bacterium Es71-Z0220]|uniref:DUF2062 domain-containing protein n=1 Tax=Deferrivibrio essentukiensis TaxID=2880922 RepID=UPI001F616311|nr:DUF2062 domain-containing protein [Deferrivibrio essentukiensis]
MKIRDKLARLLTIDRSPHIVALSSAIGMIIGFSPYVGFHTVLAIAFSYFLNLPIYPLILGAYITNPITLIFIYAFCYKVGLILTDTNVDMVLDWTKLNWDIMLHNVKQVLWPFFVGCHIVGVFAAIITYFAVYFIIKRYRGAVVG